ncbi:MAG: sugar ABC transporter ATP-binding protein [Anaerolineales bacterium]|nr:sugar ABC transporter ATP-binding protein [Anaerolineales bacterium]
MDEFVLEVRNISKSFPGVKALDQVDLGVKPNEIVGLVGENGAGKSTLLKILIGAYQPDEGEFFIRGQVVKVKSVKEAEDRGLAMVFQEQSLLPNISVRENLFLGNEEQFLRFGVINWKQMDREAKRLLEKVELDINPSAYTADLKFATRQMVELARVMSLEDRTNHQPIVILDEPTTVLEKNEIDLLFQRIRSLKERASIIFVSHHLDEILELTDRVYIFKDGRNVADRQTSETSESELHHLMVGRELKGEYYRLSKQITPADHVVMSIQNLTKEGQYDDFSLDLHKGEIIGLAGVLGSGREEVCRTIAGLVNPDQGQILINNQPLSPGSPSESIKAGIGYVPQDRGVEGLVLYLSIGPNITLPDMSSVIKRGFLSHKKEKELAESWIDRMAIKTPSANALCLNLSGGNQQKVVLSKWLASKVQVFVLDHPTRGVDVGAKEEVYELIRDLASQGISFLLIADTLEETIGLSNVILTMKDGQITQRIEAPSDNKPQPIELIQHMM